MNNKDLVKNISYFILAFVAVVVMFNFTNIFGEKEVIDNIPMDIGKNDLKNLNISEQMSEFDNYIEIKDKGKYVKVNSERIVSPQFTAHDQDANNKIALEFLEANSYTLSSTGNIEKGYLYLKAGVGTEDDIGTVASNESVFVYLGSDGGHLFSPKSLINIPSDDGYSQYLFKLEDIIITTIPYSNKNKSSDIDWLSQLDNASDYYLGGFVSSNRFGVIEEISIAYEGEGSLSLK
jgi:hypothetical protein